VIVVLGRPSVHRPEPDGELAPSGLASDIARALVLQGGAVELAGSIGDDPEGDRVIVELGRAGIGHAAMLRDPSARTPSTGPAMPGAAAALGRPLPRLEAADVELALGYLADCRVLLVAETLDPDALAAGLRAAEYHDAAVVIVAEAGAVDPDDLGDRVTLLERPAGVPEADDATPVAEDGEALAEGRAVPRSGEAIEDEAAFAGFVAEYALRLDRGEPPARAFAAALGDSAWEPAAE
jgi:sugar/nucleoside kinase (ribokinase family)